MGGILSEVLEGIAKAVQLWEQGNEEDREAARLKMISVRDTLLRPAKTETASEHMAALAEAKKAIADAQAKFDTSDSDVPTVSGPAPEIIR